MRCNGKLLAGLLWLAAATAGGSEREEQLFVRRVGPLFHEKCLPCHGGDPDKLEGSLTISDLPGLLRGGDSGEPAVVAGRPEQSPLYLAVTRTHDAWSPMPPKEADRLNEQQLTWIKDWIAGGAPWPDAARAAEIAKANAEQWSAEDGIPVTTSGGLSAEWTNRKYRPEALWAYREVQKPEVPPSEHPIDALLLARMPPGLSLAPSAERATLLRRATFDLTGLPPTPVELYEFQRDPLPDAEAFAKVVERLLASPHYGERMAQHWLDVVRYADSSGFANDYERGNAWRYRDYVVRSFNDDKPYDQFVREQLAGDELDPDNPELLVATGFLRMGPWELTGMEVAKIARQRFLDDVTNSVGETFLAHSLQCARCHDHKFDPIPTRDYYALQAVFATTQLAERAAPYLSHENLQGFEERRFLEQRRAEHLAMVRELDAKLLASAEAWYQQQKLDPAKWRAAVAEVSDQARSNKQREYFGVFDAARNALMRQGVPEDQFPPKLVGFEPADYGNERVARKGLERLRWEFERYEPYALSVYNGRTPDQRSVNSPTRIPANRLQAGELEQTCILIGGSPFGPGEPVKPGVLSVLSPLLPAHEIPTSIEGRRRALADWIANAENPLTTRTIVNRVWLWHFTQPLAGNPNNFGSTGKRPTHPELLDWLAATFVEEGWSFKALHRRILSSAAYQRSARHPDFAQVVELDPAGTSYAVFRPRRLTAEELRDAMLAATGELNPVLGGIPNRPEIHPEVALQPRMVMGTFAAAWTANPLPAERHRRSLYALKLRGLADPWLEVFNAPAPDFSCERREASTVTPQVFSLFNGQASHARALALAQRAVTETEGDEQALALCFRLVFARSPSAEELRMCLAHWREIEALPAADVAYTPPPLEVRRDAVEENTGENFSFQEKLPAHAEFVPDLQPADVPPHTRALADVCLSLLNSNEFLYVY